MPPFSLNPSSSNALAPDLGLLLVGLPRRTATRSPLQQIQRPNGMDTASKYAGSHLRLRCRSPPHSVSVCTCCHGRRQAWSTKHHRSQVSVRDTYLTHDMFRYFKFKARQHVPLFTQWLFDRREVSLLSDDGRRTNDNLFFSGELGGSFSALSSTSNTPSGNAIALGLAAGNSFSLE